MKIIIYVILLVALGYGQSLEYKLVLLESQREILIKENSSIEVQIGNINQEIGKLNKTMDNLSDSEIIAISKLTMNGTLRQKPTPVNNVITND